jgi:hypothetical protein
MSSSPSRRVVLYYPERGDPKLGQPYSADLMPLEFLHICAPAMEEGFTFDIIDSMVEADPMGKLWEKLEGAFAFGSTCIVGYQVADGADVARQVRERHPGCRSSGAAGSRRSRPSSTCATTWPTRCAWDRAS